MYVRMESGYSLRLWALIIHQHLNVTQDGKSVAVLCGGVVGVLSV